MQHTLIKGSAVCSLLLDPCLSGYNPRTLHIPPDWFKKAKVSEGQRQWCAPLPGHSPPASPYAKFRIEFGSYHSSYMTRFSLPICRE